MNWTAKKSTTKLSGAVLSGFVYEVSFVESWSRFKQRWLQFWVVLAFAGLLFHPLISKAEPGLESNSPIMPYLNGVFPTTAPVALSFDGTAEWTTRNYYPDLKFVEPLRIIEHPNQNKLLIIGKDGMGHLVTHTEGATDKQEFFNIQPIMHGNPGVGEGGISDLAFHPEFGDSRSPNAAYVYISYWWSPVNSGTFSDDNGIDGYNRLSRFEVVGGQVDLSTELIMINQYDREFWHIAMNLEFGADGFLYLSVGDETPTDCCDLRDTTQRLDGGLWSGILRIDVDNDATRSHPIRRQPIHPGVDPTTKGARWPESYTQGYSIPNDNPFVSADGANLEEFYAIGLRHSWTMSFDDETGELWVGDVGHHRSEEINLIEKGNNYEWPYKEGTSRGVIRNETVSIGVPTPPVYEYPRDVGRAIIGAGVYRGRRYPDLFGKYVFSDFVSGGLWAATPSAGGVEVEQIGELSSGWGNGVVSYLLDSKGQILLAKTNGGQKRSVIQTLVRESENVMTEQAPEFLSQTGAFSDLMSLTPADGCVPYSVNIPFWSDGAEKSRWVCLPNDGDRNSADEVIEFSEDGIWTFPVGTVFVKHFDMESVVGDPSSSFKLETRFLVHGEEGYYGLSYRWTEDGSDAELVHAAGDTFEFMQQSAEGSIDREWEFPSQNQCQECHLVAAGGALSANTRQLNKSHVYASTGIESNQLETFHSLGMFSEEIDVESVISSAITSVAVDDTSASVEYRARSYLDANCAGCHRPEGVRATFDARLTTALSDQGLLDGKLLDTYGIDDAAVIVPGSVERSIVYHRASRTDGLSMPPLAKAQVDEPGMALLRQWILSINPDPNADTDGDGVPDVLDAFADDPLESVDTDGDGVGDNSDADPNDANVGANTIAMLSGGGSGGGSWSWWLALSMLGLLVARCFRTRNPQGSAVV